MAVIMKLFSIIAVSFLSMSVFAASPSFDSFNTDQFGTNGFKVVVKNGALFTNSVILNGTNSGTTTFPSGSSVSSSGVFTGNGAGLTGLTGYVANTQSGISNALGYLPLSNNYAAISNAIGFNIATNGAVSVPSGLVTNSASVPIIVTGAGGTTTITTSSVTTLTITATNLIAMSTNNDNAIPGYIGEFISSLVPSGSSITLASTIATNVTSITLTPGDWDVAGNVNYAAVTATVTGMSAGVSTTSSTLPADGSEAFSGVQLTLLSASDSVTLPRKRVSISATTTVYLVGKSTFSAGSVSVFGQINARRSR